MATTFDLRHVCFEGKPAVAVGRKAERLAHRQVGGWHAPPSAAETADGFVAWVMDRAGLDASLYQHGSLAAASHLLADVERSLDA